MVLAVRCHIAMICAAVPRISCSAVRRRFPDGEGDRVRGQVRRRHHDVDQHLLHVHHISLTFFHFMHVILGMVIIFAVIWVQATKGLTAAGIRTAWSGAFTGTWSICCGSSSSPLVYVMR